MEPGTESRYATHSELEAVEQRLGERLVQTERILRDRDDEKERGLRAEFTAAVERSAERTARGFTEVKDILQEQNRWIMRDRFAWAKDRKNLLLMMVATIGAMLLAHYVFGVG